MKNLKVLLSFVLLAALILAVVPSMAQESSITVAIGGDPTTLDPQAADDGNERAVNDNIYETLITRDDSMALQPLLAESWEQIDATNWSVKVKSGISFTNGEPLNAEAVAFSINRVINPDFNSEQLSFFETITGAAVVDDLTVTVTTSGDRKSVV